MTALFDGAAPADVYVVKGPAFDPPPNFLAVGWDRSDQPGITASNENADASGMRGVETFDVSSLLSYSYDANNIDTALDLIMATFEALTGALAVDRTLGGAVMNARISEYELTPILTEMGAVMDLRFTTHVQAMK